MNSNDKEFLLSIKSYIEREEIANDAGWGMGRNLKELIIDDDMPDIYAEVIKRLEKL